MEAGRGELDLRPVPSAELLAPLAESFRERAEEAGIELVVEEGDGLPPVTADASRVQRVLASLVDNALRYVGRGGHVVVSADHVGRFVQFTVADDGPGIPIEDQGRIFEKFVRLGRPGDPEGSGLGLAVAREVVRAHRGAIWLDSGPGPGSVFSFTIPAASAEEAGTGPAGKRAGYVPSQPTA
jgi:two-component system, NtrC family, sensor histidine kinase KinB